MQAKTKVVLVSGDQSTIDEIRQGFKICLPEVELLTALLGSEGIKLVKSCMPNLVILDTAIPDMNIWDIYEQINLNAKVPVLLLSYSHEESDIVKSLEAGVDTYIVKPFRQLELMAHIRSILRRSLAKT